MTKTKRTLVPSPQPDFINHLGPLNDLDEARLLDRWLELLERRPLERCADSAPGPGASWSQR